jgi:hypothetical protein
MAATAIKTPQTVRDDGTTCRFNHGYNAIYFDFQRKDTLVTNIFNGGSLKLGLIVGDNEAFQPGKKCYLSLTTDQGVISGVYDVLIVSELTIGLSTFDVVIIDFPFQAYTGVSGFVNSFARSNYKLIVDLNITGFGMSSTRAFTPDNTGKIRVYVQNILQGYFEKRYEIDYDLINEKIENLALQFRLRYKEEWLNNYDEVPQYLSGSWRAVKTVEQIDNDNRMVDYEVYYQSNLKASTAKFLTAFTTPVYFKGYPFNMSFLLGFSTKKLIQVIVPQTGSNIEEDILTGTQNSVNSMTLSAEPSGDFVNVYLKTGDADDTASNYVSTYVNNYVK